MRLTASIILIALLSASISQGALKRQNAPPMAQQETGNDTSSLDDTLKYIQAALTGLGSVHFVVNYHDGATGQDWDDRYKIDLSTVEIDVAACMISYREKMVINDTVSSDRGFKITLKTVASISVMQEEKFGNKSNAAGNRPTFTTRDAPPAYVLKTVRADDNRLYVFYFLEQDLANRVAKAMGRGVALCGGAAKMELSEEKN